MTRSSDRDDSKPRDSNAGQRGNRTLGSKSKVGGIAVVLLVAAYSVAAPHLNSRFDWNLPQIKTDSAGNVRLADTPPRSTESGPSRETSSKEDSGPPTDSSQNRSPSPEATTSQRTSADAVVPDEELHYGLLREVSRDRFVSPAGLLYTPGSAEGHRLEHLRRHTKDDPGRPGSHGVFDGEMEGALKTVDRAYEKAKSGQRTTKQVDDERTIYTVDMGGRVGYVGGRDGNRKRKPMARRVRLVLEGNRVITAYPL